MWLSELDSLREQFIEYKDERTKMMNGEVSLSSKTNKKKVISKGVVKKGAKKELIVLED